MEKFPFAETASDDFYGLMDAERTQRSAVTSSFLLQTLVVHSEKIGGDAKGPDDADDLIITELT